jgi:RNA polymerase sigma factor (TIGR02999 family)
LEAVLPDPVPNDLSTLLAEAQRGTPAALDAVFEATYSHLRAVARSLLRRERPDHTLQATDLVHAAWIKLVDQSRVSWTDRAHFLNIGARAMRQILVDHARRRHAAKRMDGAQRITFNEDAGHGAAASFEVLALHDALERFSTLDPRAATVVEARVFGGMSTQEVAHVLNVSTRTVELDWTVARRWLARELREGADGR